MPFHRPKRWPSSFGPPHAPLPLEPSLGSPPPGSHPDLVPGRGGHPFCGLPYAHASALGALAMKYWGPLGTGLLPNSNLGITWGEGLSPVHP